MKILANFLQTGQIRNQSPCSKNNISKVKCVSFGTSLVEPLDKFYKVSLQKGLKEKFDLNCKLEDLNSIAGPFELKKLIAKFSPRDYELGPKWNGLFFGEKAHKYALDGTFRVNMHLHSTVSDGYSSPEEILEMSTEYADKVARKLSKRSMIPPYTTALTDHDEISGNIDIIKKIAENPKKYKNVKYVTGSELFVTGYKIGPFPAFEAIALGFNPFDVSVKEALIKHHSQPNPLDILGKVKNAGGILSLAHPLTFLDRINNDFFQFLKTNGVDGIEGNYQYCGYEYSKGFRGYIEKAKVLAKENNMFLTGGTDSHERNIFGYLGDDSDGLLKRILEK